VKLAKRSSKSCSDIMDRCKTVDEADVWSILPTLSAGGQTLN